MSLPRIAAALLRRLAPEGHAEDVLGDLEEAHSRRLAHRGRAVASLLTALECLDMARALIIMRIRSNRPHFSWLDFKLGVRMLVRYPGLTIVGGLAMAFGISVGSASFEGLTQLVSPSLPLEDGHRLVGIRIRNAAYGRGEPPTLHDFVNWREQLESVEELGAFRTVARNLIVEQEVGEPVPVTEISAAGFGAARVRPLAGRALAESDERAAAPSVVVVGYDVWQTRFEGAADVVGRTVRLGGAPTTVVGVMPEDFVFPLSSSFWAPLRLGSGSV